MDEDAEWDVHEGDMSERVVLSQISKGKNSLLKEKLDRSIQDIVALLEERGFLHASEEACTFRAQEVKSQRQQVINSLYQLLEPGTVRLKNAETQTSSDEYPSVEDYKARLEEINHLA
mmetsp:Transcript_31257/g.47836  ORF Transcript_31257/g.47836 Transcript_31257/m.47836 type:complete len:118 (+) Transcript_31257:255-608(+)